MNMFAKHWKILCAAFLGLFAVIVGCAKAQTPQAVVQKYCSLDALGANYSASNPNSKAIWQLLTNEDEAGYDQSVIIKSHQFGKSKVDSMSASVEVIYADLGAIGGELDVKKEPRTESVTFHLTKIGNEWKIDGLRILPHISQQWMLSKLRSNLVMDQKAGKNDPRLKAAISEIGRW